MRGARARFGVRARNGHFVHGPRKPTDLVQHAPEPGGMYPAECGMYNFEISKMSDTGYVLRMWQIRPED